jgi:hypothetical protein
MSVPDSPAGDKHAQGLRGLHEPAAPTDEGKRKRSGAAGEPLPKGRAAETGGLGPEGGDASYTGGRHPGAVLRER